jgi:hypothetical protein
MFVRDEFGGHRVDRSFPRCRRPGSAVPAAAFVAALREAEAGEGAARELDTTQLSWM